ncbi:hypothetical protein B484DRAFT_439804, partial [Ochromonadaceae sp. CCMP2298]
MADSRALFGQAGARLGALALSAPTVSWLEMILVEVSLRNRDRFTSFWPILKAHYLRTLTGPHVRLSYTTERRAAGLLKICTRMISRDHLSGSILEIMGMIFAQRDEPGAPLAPLAPGAPGAQAMPRAIGLQLAPQISAAVWEILTLNVDLLPLLPIEQWQTLFSIISLSASAGAFSAIKSFESMAWLLHEPRLIAKVPVFCIIGVRPLVYNVHAPLSVSIGAVQLLMHLHSRLE